MNNFLFNTIKEFDDNKAKELVGKHIHFTYHNKEENTIETLPGKVLDFNNNKLKIYTLDIIFDDADDNNDNKFVKEIDLKDVKEVFIFDKYNKYFYKLLDDIKEDDLLKDEFEITNVFGDKIISKILNCEDSLFIKIKINNKEYCYPTYFIDSIKKI